MNTNDVFNHYNSLIILHYFDIFTQQLTLVKYLLVNQTTNNAYLRKYIRNTILCDPNTKQKYYRLKQILNITQRQEKLKIRVVNQGVISCVIFELHASEITHKKIMNDYSILHEAYTLKHFCYHSGRYLLQQQFIATYKKPELNDDGDDINSTIIECTNDNSERNCTTYHNGLEKLKLQLNGIHDTHPLTHISDKYFANNKYIVPAAAYKLHPTVFKYHLSKYIFNEVILPNNIEIYSLPSDGILLETSRFYPPGEPGRIGFEIVSYDTITKTEYEDQLMIYKINIYSQSQAPFPYTHHQFSFRERYPKLQIKIKIKRGGTVNEIMQCLIPISKHPLFRCLFKDVKDSLENYIKSTHSMCFMIRKVRVKDDYCCSSMVYNSTDQISQKRDSEFDCRKTGVINLFLVPNEIDNRVHLHRLMIRFSGKDEFKKKEHNNQLLGLPLYVYVESSETMQNVLDNNTILQQYKKYIFSTYYVQNGINKLISKANRRKFKLYSNLLSNDPNAWIVITLKQESKICVKNHSKLYPPYKLFLA
eukprot:290204_1